MPDTGLPRHSQRRIAELPLAVEKKKRKEKETCFSPTFQISAFTRQREDYLGQRDLPKPPDLSLYRQQPCLAYGFQPTLLEALPETYPPFTLPTSILPASDNEEVKRVLYSPPDK